MEQTSEVFRWNYWPARPTIFSIPRLQNLPAVQELEESGLLEINAADARARGIANGDQVRVFNGRGEVSLEARVDGKVQPGVVSARLNWAKMSPGFQSINALTSEKLTDMGNSATFYSVLVEVELTKPGTSGQGPVVSGQ